MRWFVRGLLASGMTMIAAAAALADTPTFPTRNVRILIPFTGGSATDIASRVVADALRAKWTQGVVIENKPGVFGILAIEEMARSKPDGHTLMFGNVSTNAITPIVYGSKMKIDFDKDVVTVAKVSDLYSFLLVTAAGGFQPASVAELVAYGKAHPGELRYTVPSIASYQHYDLEHLQLKEGFEATAVASKSGVAGMLQDIQAGDVHFGRVNSGLALRVRAIAFKGPARNALMPDVPTMAEAGFADFTSSNWASILAPAATPRKILEVIRQSVAEVAGLPQVREALEKQQVHLDVSPSLEAAKAFNDKEVAYWKKVTAESRIKLQ